MIIGAVWNLHDKFVGVNMVTSYCVMDVRIIVILNKTVHMMLFDSCSVAVKTGTDVTFMIDSICDVSSRLALPSVHFQVET